MRSKCVWPLSVMLVGSFVSPLFSCATPFAVLAVISGFTMSRRLALGVVGGLWVLDQCRLYGTLRCAPNENSLLWGGAILIIALAITFAASLYAERATQRNGRVSSAAILGGSVIGFSAQQLGYLTVSHVLGGLDAMSLPIVAMVGMTNALTGLVFWGMRQVMQQLIVARQEA